MGKILGRLLKWAVLTTISLSPLIASGQHPLDPLSADEIIGAATILLAGHAAQPGAAFQSVELREPRKEAVLSYSGGAIDREALVYFRQNRRSFRSVVNLTRGSFTPPVEIPRKDGQLGLTIGEIFDFAFLLRDPAFKAAMAKRGIDTPDELAKVFVTPLTAGSFDLPEESRRIVKAQMYSLEGSGINLYARPIEGVQAIVDLDTQQVIQILDTGVIPVPTASHNFDEDSVRAQVGLRDPMKPIRITQPQGNNITFTGNFVEWQKWRFHLRFDRRVGTAISTVTYDNRSVLYQGALSEIFVPYQDPDRNWFYRTYMDAGEFGVGALASPLKLGLDVPENATLRSAVISAAIPGQDVPVVPLPLDNVIGVFERVTGNPIWRHYELFAPGGPLYEGRAEVELVVRMIAQVGNYDYQIDWIFGQNAVIRAEVSLTGIDVARGVVSRSVNDRTAEADTAHGALVAPQLAAIYHSHHFNFRLDLDVDGRANNFVLGKLVTQDTRNSPRKSVWALEEKTLQRERQGILDDEESVWKVISPTRTNDLGYPTGYMLESEGNAEPLLKLADYRRAMFIEHDLWVTAYDRDERFASGDTPNQNPGFPGLPEYVQNDESIRNTDIVLWHNLSFHHVTTTEDYPVLSREHKSFELKPSHFFNQNPALDLRRAPFEVK